MREKKRSRFPRTPRNKSGRFSLGNGLAFILLSFRSRIHQDERASTLQSIITRAIGADDTVEPDFFAAELQVHDILLLATDGLTRYLQPEEIAAIASPQAEPTAICETLVGLTKQRGGADNITCIVLHAVEATPLVQS